MLAVSALVSFVRSPNGDGTGTAFLIYRQLLGYAGVRGAPLRCQPLCLSRWFLEMCEGVAFLLHGVGNCKYGDTQLFCNIPQGRS